MEAASVDREAEALVRASNLQRSPKPGRVGIVSMPLIGRTEQGTAGQ
jgi:hypothetical protein